MLLIVRGLLRRLSLSGTPAVTFCSVHIHRPASTAHRRLIGGDFNMSAFSTFGDAFTNPEFSAPGNSSLEADRECTGLLIIPQRPYDWRVDTHGCYKIR